MTELRINGKTLYAPFTPTSWGVAEIICHGVTIALHVNADEGATHFDPIVSDDFQSAHLGFEIAELYEQALETVLGFWLAQGNEAEFSEELLKLTIAEMYRNGSVFSRVWFGF